MILRMKKFKNILRKNNMKTVGAEFSQNYM